MKMSKIKDVVSALMQENIDEEKGQIKGNKLESIKHSEGNQPAPTQRHEEPQWNDAKTEGTKETKSGNRPQSEMVAKESWQKYVNKYEVLLDA